MKRDTTGEVIRDYREKLGITTKQLAEKMGVKTDKVIQWEADFDIPDLSLVEKLVSALEIPEDEVWILDDAIDDSRIRKRQKEAAMQEQMKEQNEEYIKLEYKEKAFRLFSQGLLGFLGGVLFIFVTGAYKDFPWYGPLAIGWGFAGTPFGWSVLSDKTEKSYRGSYFLSYDAWLFDLIITVICKVLMFIGAFFIGYLTFPVILLYNAFKAGRKGSVYQKIMGVALTIVGIVYGLVILTLIAMMAQNR